MGDAHARFLAYMIARTIPPGDHYYVIGSIVCDRSKTNIFSLTEENRLDTVLSKFQIRWCNLHNYYFAVRTVEEAVMFRLSFDLPYDIDFHEMDKLMEENQ